MDDRVTVIRFDLDSTAAWVTAQLLEATRRTGLSLVSLSGNGTEVYPRNAWNADVVAETWRAELRLADAVDAERAVSTFMVRADTFLAVPDGIHTEAPTSGYTPTRPSRRSGSAYGLDGSFNAAQNRPV